jgi:hypothetical protein
VCAHVKGKMFFLWMLMCKLARCECNEKERSVNFMSHLKELKKKE